MTGRPLAVLTYGGVRLTWCTGCQTNNLAVADVCALLDSGVVPIGQFAYCPRCAEIESEQPKGDAHA